jgi:hypothetical protein
MSTETEDELKSLIRSPKPAFAAHGITDAPNRGLKFSVVHNGREAWMIERPGITELLAEGRTILVKSDAVEVLDLPVAVNNDVKSALDGRRFAYLESSFLEIEGTTVVAGRRCHQLRVRGLKHESDAVFDMAVDMETGIVLRIATAGNVILEVTDFRIGIPRSE